MPRRIAVSTLNATTMDILNVIRQNASYDYQQNVPEVTKTTDIPKVGSLMHLLIVLQLYECRVQHSTTHIQF